MYVKPQPIGVNQPNDEDRTPVFHAVSGDSFELATKVMVPPSFDSPADPDNSRIEFKLSENRFAPTIWTGTWHDGVSESDGLVHVKIPQTVMSSLRRGSYAFSLKVSTKTGLSTRTVMTGNILVEYEPTSPIKDIPYRRSQA